LNGGNHLAIGAGSTVIGLCGLAAFGAPLDPVTIAFGALAGGLGALMPDIDHPRATASRGLPRKLIATAVEVAAPLILIAVMIAGLGGPSFSDSIGVFVPALKMAGTMLGFAVVFVWSSAVARRFTTHRGATHSLLAAGVSTLVATLGCVALSAPAWFGLLFGWGWLTHLAADATTKLGVPSLLWWPFGSLGTTHTVTAPAPARTQVPTSAWAAMHDLALAPTVPICPKCDIPMVVRTARHGAHRGEQFYGCENYPRCLQISPLRNEAASPANASIPSG